MIEVKNLNKQFKKTVKEPGLKGSIKSLFHPKSEIVEAVKDISFNIDDGEVLGFIGPNGAGKSTVIKMLTGILTPTKGSCTINGKNPTENRKSYVKEIGVVFGQRTQLWWDLPLRETYGVLKEMYEVPEDKFKERMGFLNEVLELESFITSPVRTLSLGQRMRADIAAALLHSPKVLFLDEPTIGLDVVVKNNIRNAIEYINKQEKTTVILTTHDLADIEFLANRIVMIDKGGIVGTTVIHTDLNGDNVRVILGDQLLNAQTGIALAAFLVVQEILDHRAAPGAVDHHIIATAGLIQILLKPLRVAVHACGELFIVGNGVTGHDAGQVFLGSEDLFHSHAVIVLESGAALACRGCDGCEYRQHHAQDQRKGHEGF